MCEAPWIPDDAPAFALRPDAPAAGGHPRRLAMIWEVLAKLNAPPERAVLYMACYEGLDVSLEEAEEQIDQALARNDLRVVLARDIRSNWGARKRAGL